MSFLLRLAERSLGLGPRVEPLQVSRFAQTSSLIETDLESASTALPNAARVEQMQQPQRTSQRPREAPAIPAERKAAEQLKPSVPAMLVEPRVQARAMPQPPVIPTETQASSLLGEPRLERSSGPLQESTALKATVAEHRRQEPRHLVERNTLSQDPKAEQLLVPKLSATIQLFKGQSEMTAINEKQTSTVPPQLLPLLLPPNKPSATPALQTRSSLGQAYPQPETTPSDPVIRVSIGRLEVRAVTPPAPLPKPKPQPRSQTSLDDYLKRFEERS
jgi:hypothetical protein